jgi:serine/threonine protein kinase
MEQITLSKKLGQGQFGTVYLGYRPHDPKFYAVKVIDKAKINTLTNKRRLEKEIEIPKYLDCKNKNIFCLRDVIETPDKVYILSEYIPGSKDLEHYKVNFNTLEGQLLALDIFYQLASGLEYMHEMDVVHRDIKPSNIIMKGHVPIYIDFDLSCVFGDPKFKCRGQSGSPYYLAPEVWNDTSHDWFKVDIFALGVTMYEFFNDGQFPYPAEEKEELEEKVLHGKPIPSNSGDKRLDDIIMSMLSKDFESRPSAEMLKIEIAGLIQNW